MSKQEDILAGDFGLTDEVAPVAKSADAETLVTRLEDRFSDSMTLLKRIPVTLTLEVSSVEIMLADLLNIDDDTVIELDKLAGEPLDIKVNNILLGKASVECGVSWRQVVDIAGVKFQHAQAVLLVDHHHFRFAQQDIVHFNIQRLPGDINVKQCDIAALGQRQRGERQQRQAQRQNSGTDSDDPRRFAADDGADDDLFHAFYYRAVTAAPGAGAATNAAKPHSDWYCALTHPAGNAPHLAQYLRPRGSAVRKRSDYPDRCVKHRRDAAKTLYAGADRQKSDGANHDHRRREGQCRRPGSLHRGARLCTERAETAFQIGFMIYIPFLVIDLIVASVLMAMGMMMLSPLIVSLPFKLMLFVLIDGWSLTIGTLTTSIRGLGLG